MSEQDLSHILANIYGDSQEYIEWVIERYREYYALPIITKTEEITPRLFQFYRRGQHFIVVAISNESNEVLIVKEANRDHHDDSPWQLIGSFIKEGETIEDVCDRIVKSKTKLQIDEIEPLAVVKSEFKCQDRAILHYGLAFLVYTRGTPTLPSGDLGVYVAQCPEQLAYSNKEILAIALEKINHKKTFVPYDEIEISRSHAIKQFIHKMIINKPFDRLSSKLLREKVKKFCEKADTILDVACGNDTLILELARNAKFCVANDISWSTLQQLRKKNSLPNVVFTNHNATDLPFRKKFDVVLCKNALHHMHNLSELVDLTKVLKNVGSKIILIDIENPLKSTLWAKIWHEYYVRFLGDRGRYFLTRDEFEKVISHIFENAIITFDVVSTLKGNYMCAVVETRT